jgi:nicotinamide-nucleotide adenylyltransferase
VRNIEKTPKKGDATVMQRLEMTVLLAEALAQVEAGSTLGNGEVTEGRDSNRQKMPVAVGILNEPTFVGKSRIIHRFLSSRTSMAPNGAQAATGDHAVHSGGTDSMTARNEHERPTLSFLIGTDTLTRFFDPKFYPMGMDRALHSFFASPTTGVDTASSAEAAGDGSVLVSARRGTTPSDRTLEQDVLANGVAKRWAEAGKVRLLGDGSEGWEEISSTRIREAVGRGDWEEVRRLVPGSVADYIESNGLYRA